MSDDYPLTSDTGKRYRMISDTVREYESGAQWDEDTKQILPFIGRGADPVQLQAASVASRYERAADAARLGLVAGISAVDPLVAAMAERGIDQDKLEMASLAVLAAKMAEIAYSADGAASVSAFRTLFAKGGYELGARQQVTLRDAAGNQVTGPVDQVTALLDVVRAALGEGSRGEGEGGEE